MLCVSQATQPRGAKSLTCAHSRRPSLQIGLPWADGQQPFWSSLLGRDIRHIGGVWTQIHRHCRWRLAHVWAAERPESRMLWTKRYGPVRRRHRRRHTHDSRAGGVRARLCSNNGWRRPHLRPDKRRGHRMLGTLARFACEFGCAWIAFVCLTATEHADTKGSWGAGGKHAPCSSSFTVHTHASPHAPWARRARRTTTPLEPQASI